MDEAAGRIEVSPESKLASSPEESFKIVPPALSKIVMESSV